MISYGESSWLENTYWIKVKGIKFNFYYRNGTIITANKRVNKNLISNLKKFIKKRCVGK